VRVLLLSFVQGLYAEAPPGCYRWNPDDEKSEIIIRDESPLRVERVGARPAISLTMGSIQFYNLGLDDMFTFDVSTGRKVKVVLIPGVVSLNCCSRVQIEAQNIACTVDEHIWLLRELLLKQGFFEIGRNIQVGPPSSPGSVVAGDEGDEWYVSTVNVPFQFGRKSAFTPLWDSIVQNIELNLNTTRRNVTDGKGGPAVAGHELPVRVHECPPEAFVPGASDARGRTPDGANAQVDPPPIYPHPLDPSKKVYVTTIRPYRVNAPKYFNKGLILPIERPCK
jgi:hypothetical protein